MRNFLVLLFVTSQASFAAEYECGAGRTKDGKTLEVVELKKNDESRIFFGELDGLTYYASYLDNELYIEIMHSADKLKIGSTSVDKISIGQNVELETVQGLYQVKFSCKKTKL